MHPYDEVTWERRDVVQTNWKTGETVFEQRGVEFPDFWSVNASTIVTTKYFRGAVGTDAREWSLKQLIDRVVQTYTQGRRATTATSPPTADAEIFEHELTWMLLHQVFIFNSPGLVQRRHRPRRSRSRACFILAVDDTMDSILNWYQEEGLIFKGGSGAGLNLSRIRSSKELLSSGGTASGPVSFMRGADASAGTIKSGGATRRAAKMVVLDVDHPDIEEFVETKAREEDKIRALRDAGFDMDLGGNDITSRPVPERQQLGPRHRRVHARGRGRHRVRPARPRAPARSSRPSTPASCSARSPRPRGSAPTRASSTTTRSTTGTPTPRPAGSPRPTRARSTCRSTTPRATWPSLNLLKFLKDDDTFDAATVRRRPSS